jgi:hypothetical protein
LTGIASQSDLMHNYDTFDRDTRINKFRVEDYYFIRNQLRLKKDLKEVEPDNREVIHVMID